MTTKRSSEEKGSKAKLKDLTQKIKQTVKKTLSSDEPQKPKKTSRTKKESGAELLKTASDETTLKKTDKRSTKVRTAEPTEKSNAKKAPAKAAAPRKAVRKAQTIQTNTSESAIAMDANSVPRKVDMDEKPLNSSEPLSGTPPDPIHVGISTWPSSPIGGGADQPHAAPMYDPYVDPRPLPESYGRTRLTLLVRDPEWLFSFWEISEEDRQRNGLNGGAVYRMVLRVYDVTETGDPSLSETYHDIVVTEMAKSWYLHVARPSRSWVADLGYYDSRGHFVTLARSNAVATPSDRLSDVIDEQWMQVDEESFTRLIKMSSAPGMLGGSEMLGIEIGQRLIPQFMPGASEMFSLAASERKAPGPVPFHLQVRYELIVYGATEPDASVTLCGEPIRLRPDGTFTVRYELPDGERNIEVKAVKSTGDQFREAGALVTKQSH